MIKFTEKHFRTMNLVDPPAGRSPLLESRECHTTEVIMT